VANRSTTPSITGEAKYSRGFVNESNI
jgi:hypothetical protein